MTYNEHINVALAVAMPDGGLITPVIKDADATDIYQISRNWVRQAQRAGGYRPACASLHGPPGTWGAASVRLWGSAACISAHACPRGPVVCREGVRCCGAQCMLLRQHASAIA